MKVRPVIFKKKLNPQNKNVRGIRARVFIPNVSAHIRSSPLPPPAPPPPAPVPHRPAPAPSRTVHCTHQKPSAPAVTMVAAPASGAARALSLRERDMLMMLAAEVHLGTKNCDYQMERYTHSRRADGISPILSNLTNCLHRMPVGLDILFIIDLFIMSSIWILSCVCRYFAAMRILIETY